MRSENKTRFLPAVEPSTAGFISDSVPTGEPSPAGFISDYVHVHQRWWMCFIYLPTKVGGSAPTGGCTHNELKIGEDEGFRLVTNVSDQLEGGGESGVRRSDTLSRFPYNLLFMLVIIKILF